MKQTILQLLLLSSTKALTLPPTRRLARIEPLSLAKGFGAPQKEKPKGILTTSPENISSETASVSSTTQPPPVNSGKAALDRMRQKKSEEKLKEIAEIRDIRAVDDSLREDSSAAVIPERVAMRMGKRMLPFVGIPLFGGMGAFVAFWYFATYKNIQFQPAAVAFTTIALLAVGLLGITYSVMSASWDDTAEPGSALGFNEASKNLNSLKEGLKRSRENAIIRDRMAGMPEEEIEKAIRMLDQKEEKENTKKMTLEEKINRELE